MSYYTKYTVETTADEDEEFEIAKFYNDKFHIVDNFTKDFEMPWYYTSVVDIIFDDMENIEFDDFKEATKEVSKLHPEIYFTIYGMGEEWDDKWVLYCKNGVSELCEMKYIIESPENLDIVSRVVTSF